MVHSLEDVYLSPSYTTMPRDNKVAIADALSFRATLLARGGLLDAKPALLVLIPRLLCCCMVLTAVYSDQIPRLIYRM